MMSSMSAPSILSSTIILFGIIFGSTLFFYVTSPPCNSLVNQTASNPTFSAVALQAINVFFFFFSGCDGIFNLFLDMTNAKEDVENRKSLTQCGIEEVVAPITPCPYPFANIYFNSFFNC